jgi:TolA-binding protein
MTTEPWHLDRKVPLALIVTIILQTGLGIWWASGLTSRVDRAMQVNEDQDRRLRDVEGVAQAQQVVAASITAQISAMRDTLEMVRQDQREMNNLLRQYLEARK